MAKRNQTLYRLTLSEDATHKRIKLWRFSKLGGIITAVTAIAVLFGLYYAVMAVTPLKTTIPGYPDAHFKRGAIANAIKIDSLENEMLRWSLYAENLSRILSGQEGLSDADSLIEKNTTRFLENISKEEMTRRDSLLKSTVAREERFGVGSNRNRVLPIEGLHFFTPLNGAVSQGYDMVLHPAVDISAPAKSVVSAVLDGTVISAGWTDDAGYSIMIQHQGNIVSCYKHNQQLLKRQGDKVTAGTPIALVGNTGTGKMVQGDHLHFELWHEGEPVDPTKYCSF